MLCVLIIQVLENIGSASQISRLGEKRDKTQQLNIFGDLIHDKLSFFGALNTQGPQQGLERGRFLSSKIELELLKVGGTS